MKKAVVILSMTMLATIAFAEANPETCAQIDQAAQAEGLPWKTRSTELRAAGCPFNAQEARIQVATKRAQRCEALRTEADAKGNWQEINERLAAAGCDRM